MYRPNKSIALCDTIVKTLETARLHGFNVIAVKDKRPARDWKNAQTTPQTDEQREVQHWLIKTGQCDAVALVGGINGLVAIDIDAVDKTSPIPETLVQDITSRLGLTWPYAWCWRSLSGTGWHIWVTVPDLPREARRYEVLGGNGVWRAMEVRAWRHYTVVPPTVTLPDEPPAKVSWKKLYDTLGIGRAERTNGRYNTNKWGTPDSKIAEGGRNTTLTSIAGSLRRKGFDQETMEVVLKRINRTQCDPPLPEDEVERIAESVAKYPPGSQVVGEEMIYKDYGHASVLAELFRDRYRWAIHRGTWMSWDGTRWVPTPDEFIAREAAEALRKHYIELLAKATSKNDIQELSKKIQETCVYARITGALNFLKGWKHVMTEAKEWDTDPWLLNVANGTLDLRTGTLRPHNPHDLITKLAPVVYDPNAKGEFWNQHINRFLPNPNIRRQVQRDLGRALPGVVLEESLPLWYGRGANGKTTTARVIRKILGDYAGRAAPNLLIQTKYERHPTEIADLFGLRVVFSVEVDQGKRLAEALVKELTGGDELKGRYMRQDFFGFDPSFSIFLVCNHRPVITGDDEGIWRRIRLIPWEYSIPPEERRPQEEVVENLIKEGPAILNWLLDGLNDWRKDTHWVAEEVRAASDAYRAEMDALGEFLRERCERGPRFTVVKSTLYEAYRKWCEENHERLMTKKELTIRLRDRGIGEMRTEKNRYYVGLRLIPEPHDGTNPDEPSPNTPPDDDNPPPSGGKPTPPPIGGNPPGNPGGSDTSAAVQQQETQQHDVQEEAMRTIKQPACAYYKATQPIVWLETAQDIEEALRDIARQEAIGLDVETTTKIVGKRGKKEIKEPDRLRLVQLATQDKVYMLDAFKTDATLLTPLFNNENLVVVGHNLKFDLKMLRKAGVDAPGDVKLMDTFIASQLLSAGLEEAKPRKTKEDEEDEEGYHSLQSVVERYLKQHIDKTLQDSDWSGELTQEQIEYAARDAQVLLPLRLAMRIQLKGRGLVKAMAIEMEALPTVVLMEETGVCFNRDEWQPSVDEFMRERDDVERQLNEMAGVSINWRSYEQVKELLQQRGHAVEDTKKETLKSLEDKDPLAALVLKYRAVDQLVKAFGPKFLELVGPDGRIHPRFYQCGAVTGRMSCQDPNLQQIPRKSNMRACFVAPEGRVLVKADYSQIELRIAAEITQDKRMLEAYKTPGKDIHIMTAQLVMGRENVSDEDRRAAKAINFGLIYGMKPATLRTYANISYRANMTDEEAQKFYNRFFEAYEGIALWHEVTRRNVWENGPVATRTLSGRYRLNVDSPTEALNTPVQGTGADGLKAALGLLWKTRHKFPTARPILAVHDEIVVECDEHEAKAVEAWLIDCMKQGMQQFLPSVPVEVEATIAKDWAGKVKLKTEDNHA